MHINWLIDTDCSGGDVKKLSLAFIMFMSVQFIVTVVFADNTGLKKCVCSLNAFEIAIKNGNYNISSDWVKGTSGWLLMNAPLSRKDIDEIGNMTDILSCSEVGISPAEIDLFLLAFHGYLPADPFEDISECLAVMLLVAPEMDKELETQRSQSLSFSIGKRFGATMTQINYMYPSKKHTFDQIQDRATKIATSISGMPTDERSVAINYYLSKCSMYHIYLESVLQGAGVEIK